VLLVDQIIEGEKGDVIEDIVPDLQLVGIRDPVPSLRGSYRISSRTGQLHRDLRAAAHARSGDVLPYRARIPDKALGSCLLEVEGVDLALPVCVFNLGIATVVTVPAEFLGPDETGRLSIGGRRGTADLEDRVLLHLRGQKAFWHFFRISSSLSATEI
jgi:hypothetical protein